MTCPHCWFIWWGRPDERDTKRTPDPLEYRVFVRPIPEGKQRTGACIAVEAAQCDAVESAEALARFQAAWVQRKAEGGPFAQLLCAYEQLETACEQITRQLEWAPRAEDELRAAREETP